MCVENGDQDLLLRTPWISSKASRGENHIPGCQVREALCNRIS